jgi:N-acetylmuramoyl-L-alanine amidase
VAIDPGHGGDDAGARGAGGTEEKNVTLDLARRLRARLESRLGIRVLMTRDDDRALSPDERAAAANNGKADLFLSLHANAAPASGVAGAEVIHLRLEGEAEDARRTAAADAIALPVLSGGTRTIDVLPWDLAQARHVDASAVLATALEQELRAKVSMGPRPRQQAPMRVLLGANMPAALVEFAYLTNPAQERLAAAEEYQNVVADALFDAIVRFRSYLEGQRAR